MGKAHATPQLLFGGTFNPVHNGHLVSAMAAREALGVDRVTLLPCYVPPHKTAPTIAAEHRLAMLQHVVQENNHLCIDTCELDAGESIFTVDTLAAKRELWGADASIIWLIGWDSLHNLSRWHRWQSLLTFANLAVVERPFAQSDDINSLPPAVRNWLQQHRVSAKQLTQQANGGVALLHTPRIELSSSDIRQRLGAQKSIQYMVPACVETYIRAHKLYTH